MLVPMTPVTVLAPRSQLPAVIAELHRQRIMHLTSAARQDPGMTPSGPVPDNSHRMADLRTEADDLGQLTVVARTAASAVAAADWLRPVTVTASEQRLARLAPGLRGLLTRIEALQSEHEVAVRYRDALAVLVPLEPELVLLSENDLARLDLTVVILVLDAPHAGVLDGIRGALHEVAGDRFEMTGAQTGEQTVGCVVVLPHAASAELHALLGREHIRHVPLPEACQRRSLGQAQAELDSRLRSLPDELAEAWRSLASRTAGLAPGWERRRDQALAELDQVEALGLAGASERTASVSGWLPRRQVPRLRAALASVGPGVMVAERDPAIAGEPPALLDNPRPVLPVPAADHVLRRAQERRHRPEFADRSGAAAAVRRHGG